MQLTNSFPAHGHQCFHMRTFNSCRSGRQPTTFRLGFCFRVLFARAQSLFIAASMLQAQSPQRGQYILVGFPFGCHRFIQWVCPRLSYDNRHMRYIWTYQGEARTTAWDATPVNHFVESWPRQLVRAVRCSLIQSICEACRSSSSSCEVQQLCLSLPIL